MKTGDPDGKGSPEGEPFLFPEIVSDHYAFLKRVDFFRSLSDEEIRLLDSACHEERYEPGDVLFCEGSMADRFYIVMEGRVEVWKNWYESKPDLLGVHGAGHFFGEMALVDELPRSATVVARDGVLTLFLYRDDFRRLIREHSSVALSVMLSMSSLVRAANDAFVDDLRARNEELTQAYAELKRAQAENLKNERLSTLGKFSSMILHDIRNPLSVIKAQAMLMRDHLDSPDRLSRSLQALESEAGKLERLANEFLDYSRGEIRLGLSPLEPSELLSKAAQSMALRLEQAGVRLVVDCQARGKAIVDQDRIHRALLNLCDNARKAMAGRGDKTLRLGARYEGSELVLSVADSGSGMDDEVKAHLFEPFYSASGQGGTGLGLLIVKNIIEAHHGSLSVESEPGKGSVFTLRLPRMAQPA